MLLAWIEISINDGFKTATLRQGAITDKHAARSYTDGSSALKIFQIQILQKNVLIS